MGKTFIYIGIFITGFTALIYQVVWQRYLTPLLGSDAQSTTMVLGVFLAGLATGFHFWGKYSDRIPSRKKLLRVYASIELATGIYILIFPLFIQAVQKGLYLFPGHFFLDLIATFLLLFIPTFLMGATVPILTVILPENQNELNPCHTRVYGLNTLGALFGVLLGGLFLVPSFGLNQTLWIGAFFNFAVGISFLFIQLPHQQILESATDSKSTTDSDSAMNTASAKGEASTSTSTSTKNTATGVAAAAASKMGIPGPGPGPVNQQHQRLGSGDQNSRSRSLLYLSFLIGATTIALEIIFIRLIGLSIGNSFHVFPIGVFTVLLGLSTGVLTIGFKNGSKNGSNKPKSQMIPRQILWAIGILILSYFTQSYWPRWLSLIRARLGFSATDYYTFYGLGILFFSLWIAPVFYFLGRILPLIYLQIEKSGDNLGKICGRVFAINTLGTLLGAVLLGHLLLHWFNLDTLFKICILGLASGFLLTNFLWTDFSLENVFPFKIKPPKWALLILFPIIFFIPSWDRIHHAKGYFMKYPKPNAQGNQNSKDKENQNDPYGKRREKMLYFEDGPNGSVGIMQIESIGPENKRRYLPLQHLGLIINGKSESQTTGDFSTISLLGSIPYLYSSAGGDFTKSDVQGGDVSQIDPKDGLNAAIVGLGTGVTAGVLGKAKEIKNIDVLELSSKAIGALKHFESHNFGVTANPKINLHPVDAFEYFNKTHEKYHIVVTEPSNLWVSGMENLFTAEFYSLVKSKLTREGLLFQWVHEYSLSHPMFLAILKNLASEFLYLELFIIGQGDLGILASNLPITGPHLKRRFYEPELLKIHQWIGLGDDRLLEMIHPLNSRALNYIAKTVKAPRHTLLNPYLSFEGGRQFFMRGKIFGNRLLPPELARNLSNWNTKMDYFSSLLSDFPHTLPWCEKKLRGPSMICARYYDFVDTHVQYLNQGIPPMDRLKFYKRLRSEGIIPTSFGYSDELLKLFYQTPEGEIRNRLARNLIREFTYDGQFERAEEIFEAMPTIQSLKENLKVWMSKRKSVFNRWMGEKQGLD